MPLPTSQHGIRQAVQEHYAEVAKASQSCCGPSTCCTPSSTSLGYSVEDLTSVPEGADLGLGCGNPQLFSELKEGEVVLDLGSGAGFDCFLAARSVGESGRVIGVDMTPEMLERARQNALKGGYVNVEFREGLIEELPVEDGTIDVIMSNCVVNLSPAKAQVYQEAFRVLKPGGRIAISDVVALVPLPAEVRQELSLYSGCIAGAATIDEIKAMLQAAGFQQVEIAVKSTESRKMVQDWAPDSGLEDYVASAMIRARKA